MDEQDQAPGFPVTGAVSDQKAATESPPTQPLGESNPAYSPPSWPPAPPVTSDPRLPRSHGWHRSWPLAFILILVGVVFLVRNFSDRQDFFQNWWALFILIPAAGSFADAWRRYVHAGRRFDPKIARPLAMGLVFVALTAIFIFAPNQWDKVWPVFLIIIGLGMAFSWRRRD